MKTLWAPLEVADFDAAAQFYGETLGLKRIDTWQRNGERGTVFEIGESGRIEIVTTTEPTSPPAVALELPTRSDVYALHRRLANASSPKHFPRGHYGFVAHDPDGNPLLIWSEQ